MKKLLCFATVFAVSMLLGLELAAPQTTYKSAATTAANV